MRGGDEEFFREKSAFGSRSSGPVQTASPRRPVGAVASVPLVWAVGTLLNGFMAFPNLVGLFLLLGAVKKITADYFEKDGREYSVDHPTTGVRVSD
jgi:hypothetical protein